MLFDEGCATPVCELGDHRDGGTIRVEVTVKGEELVALGITDIASLNTVRLAAFQKRYFQFKLPTFSERSQPGTGADAIHNMKQIWRARTYLRSGVTGLVAMDAETELNRSKLKRGVLKMLRTMKQKPGVKVAESRLAAPFVSWEAMNRKVNVAFVELEKREQTAWKRLVT